MTIRKILLSSVALAIAAAAVVGVLGYRRTQGEPSYVAAVNGELITTQDWNGYQTSVAGAGVADTDVGSLQHVIDERLELQEAARRGLTCANSDAVTFEDQQDARERAMGAVGVQTLLQNAIANGYAAADTTGASPDAINTAIAAWETAPNTIGAMRTQCTLSRLAFAVDRVTSPSVGDAPQAPQIQHVPGAQQTLIAGLRARATIELAATQVATATPSP